MNEEIEYAEMLEIPVSTVNVVRKNPRRKKQKNEAVAPSSFYADTPNPEPLSAPLKDSLIAQVNDRLSEGEPAQNEQIVADADLFAESVNSEGRLEFDPIPDRIDTVRLYSEEETDSFLKDGLRPYDFSFENENEGGRYALNKKEKSRKGLKLALGIEFAAACALCGAIFLTNVFMPNSGINTFFRTLGSATETAVTDTRTYADFTLSPVVSEMADAELSLSPAGILSFTHACCVYPTADGEVAEILQSADGSYTLKIAHSDTFTGVIGGLDHVYYAVGDKVKSNVPVGYTDGEGEVQVTMYSGGELLNCFRLTEENCLAWIAD